MVVAFGNQKSVSKVVAAIQGSSDGISQRQIIAATGLSERSVKGVLKKLIAEGKVTRTIVPKDLRRTTYGLAECKTAKAVAAFGIVGGLGPETTARFYTELSERIRKGQGLSPSVVIDNVTFPIALENEIINEAKNTGKLLPCLKKSVERLNKAGAQTIVIPCNTAHIFINELRNESEARIISIVEETVKELLARQASKAGILATTATVASGLYQEALKKAGITPILPSKEQQKELARSILSILRKEKPKDFSKIANALTKKGAGTILLACTDLCQINFVNRINFDIVDTFEILLEKAIKTLEG